jgi:hypothetical protein
LRRRLLRSISPRFFQIQAWVSQEEPIAEQTKEDVLELFLKLRGKFRQRFEEAV